MEPTSNQPTEKTISVADAMAMNRADRRRLGKQNGIKILGSRTDHIKPKDKPYALETFTGHRK